MIRFCKNHSMQHASLNVTKVIIESLWQYGFLSFVCKYSVTMDLNTFL